MSQMKKSLIAKITTWILITVSGVTLAGSVLGAYVISELGFYSKSPEDIEREQFTYINQKYSALALGNGIGSGENEKYFKDTNFQYGIVEASTYEELEKMNLNAKDTYAESNFSQKVDLEKLNCFQCNLNDETAITVSDTLLGHYSITHSMQDYIRKEINQCYYDVGSGIFYYQTSDDLLYPVNRVYVVICETGENSYTEEQGYVYDPDQETYTKMSLEESIFLQSESLNPDETTQNTLSDENEMFIEKVTLADSEEDRQAWLAVYMEPAKSMTDEDLQILQDIFSKDTLTFDEFDGTGFSASNYWWRYRMIYPADAQEQNESTFQLGIDQDNLISIFLADPLPYDNVAEADMWHEDFSDNADIQSKIITHAYYDSSERGYLKVLPEYVTRGKDYYVLSVIPDADNLKEKEGVGIWGSDLYVQMNFILQIANRMKYSIYAVLIFNLVIFVISFFYLVAAAGHRRGKEGITPSVLCKVPFDLFTLFFVIVEAYLYWVIRWMIDIANMKTDVFSIFCGFSLLLCIGWCALGYFLHFIVCIKMGKWWKNTIVYKLLRAVRNGMVVVNANISILWKGLLIFIGVNLLEIILFSVFGLNYDSIAVVWFLEKAAILIAGTFLLIQMKELLDGSRHIADGDLEYKIETEKMVTAFREHGENLNRISEGVSKAVNEKMKSERFKTELITNVSHDIKTPLTSIINYVDLLEKEQIDNETVKGYLEVLDRQSARLKKLIEDLIEASKASSGSLPVHLEKLEADVFLTQTVGEFEEKTKQNQLELIVKKQETPVYIMADGRHFWRVIDNLMNNICKYAQPQTRAYINLEQTESDTLITFRNTSKYPLNISSEELMERFVRGDSSRNTEGNGLGLSIAKSLMELMDGKLELFIDGDLFKVVLRFKRLEDESDTEESSDTSHFQKDGKI